MMNFKIRNKTRIAIIALFLNIALDFWPMKYKKNKWIQLLERNKTITYK